MTDKKDICKNLAQSIYHVKAYQNDELYSIGSGFCFNENGQLITAAHVLDDGKPFKEDEIAEKKISFTAQRKNEEPSLYNANICGIQIKWPDGPIKDQLIIDLAILSPKTVTQKRPYLKINSKKRFVGQDVIMAGFPDEVEFPLLLDKKLDRDFLRNKQSDKTIDESLDRLKSLLIMQKSGMIGYTDDIIININKSSDFKLHVGVDYIDNGMHSGASGGPVVNLNGEVIGIISKRAVTRISPSDQKIPSHEIPSGSTLSITPKTIVNFFNYMISKGQYSTQTA